MRLFDTTVWAGALAVAAAVLLPGSTAGDPQPAAAPAAATPREETPPAPERLLGADEVERILDVARDVDPQLAVRLDGIRRDRSDAAFARALRHARHLRGLARLKEQDPQLYDVKVQELRIDAQVDRVLGQLLEARRTGSGTAADLEIRLKKLVEQQVGFGIVARGMYLRRLKEHVEGLETQLDEDITHFPDAVERRLKRLLDQAARDETFETSRR